MMADIALGIRGEGEHADLEAFAAKVDASYMAQWREMGLYDHDAEGWGEAFEQVVSRTLAGGGQIHFNLTGINIRQALDGDPGVWVGRYTAWELQQIVQNAEWFANTRFYLNDVLLTVEEAAALGIVSGFLK